MYGIAHKTLDVVARDQRPTFCRLGFPFSTLFPLWGVLQTTFAALSLIKSMQAFLPFAFQWLA